MGTYINKGNEGFRSVIESQYVDKTGMIAVINKTLYTERRYTCVTRCRRFGKTELAHDEDTSILSYNDENSLACVLSIAYYYDKNGAEGKKHSCRIELYTKG